MNEVIKYKNLGEMVQRSRLGGGSYVRLEDYDALQDKLSKAYEELHHYSKIYLDACDAEQKLKRDIKDIEREHLNSDVCFNAVISYILGKGRTEEPLEFLRCWNEGDFDSLREEWPDAPKEIYYADPLYKGE